MLLIPFLVCTELLYCVFDANLLDLVHNAFIGTYGAYAAWTGTCPYVTVPALVATAHCVHDIPLLLADRDWLILVHHACMLLVFAGFYLSSTLGYYGTVAGLLEVSSVVRSYALYRYGSLEQAPILIQCVFGTVFIVVRTFVYFIAHWPYLLLAYDGSLAWYCLTAGTSGLLVLTLYWDQYILEAACALLPPRPCVFRALRDVGFRY